MVLEAPVRLNLNMVDLADPDMHMRYGQHDLFRLLRREAPVHWNDANEVYAPFWSLTKYDDVMQVSRNPQLWSSEQGISIIPRVMDEAAANLNSFGRMLIVMDPPRHVRLRRLVNKGFTPRAVAMLAPEIKRITNEILDGIAARGSADFVVDVAAQLPLAVICSMMGVPRKDWDLMFQLTNKVLGATDEEYQTDLPEGMVRGSDDASRHTGQVGFLTMLQYFGQTLQELRGGRRGEDITSILIDAEVDGEKLSDDEILFFCFLLIVAGNETTRNAISGGLLAFSENPGEQARLLADPSLMDSAVEEVLRWVSPVTHMTRVATADTQIRGQKIAAGEQVAMWYPSVNRDEDIFADPYRFDIGRTPNEHLAFGIGEHFCLGAGFARLELKVMYEELFARFPDIEVTGPVERLRSNFIGGIKHLPVGYRPN